MFLCSDVSSAIRDGQASREPVVAELRVAGVLGGGPERELAGLLAGVASRPDDEQVAARVSAHVARAGGLPVPELGAAVLAVWGLDLLRWQREHHGPVGGVPPHASPHPYRGLVRAVARAGITQLAIAEAVETSHATIGPWVRREGDGPETAIRPVRFAAHGRATRHVAAWPDDEHEAMAGEDAAAIWRSGWGQARDLLADIKQLEALMDAAVQARPDGQLESWPQAARLLTVLVALTVQSENPRPGWAELVERLAIALIEPRRAAVTAGLVRELAAQTTWVPPEERVLVDRLLSLWATALPVSVPSVAALIRADWDRFEPHAGWAWIATCGAGLLAQVAAAIEAHRLTPDRDKQQLRGLYAARNRLVTACHGLGIPLTTLNQAAGIGPANLRQSIDPLWQAANLPVPMRAASTKRIGKSPRASRPRSTDMGACQRQAFARSLTVPGMTRGDTDRKITERARQVLARAGQGLDDVVGADQEWHAMRERAEAHWPAGDQVARRRATAVGAALAWRLAAAGPLPTSWAPGLRRALAALLHDIGGGQATMAVDHLAAARRRAALAPDDERDLLAVIVDAALDPDDAGAQEAAIRLAESLPARQEAELAAALLLTEHPALLRAAGPQPDEEPLGARTLTPDWLARHRPVLDVVTASVRAGVSIVEIRRQLGMAPSSKATTWTHDPSPSLRAAIRPSSSEVGVPRIIAEIDEPWIEPASLPLPTQEMTTLSEMALAAAVRLADPIPEAATLLREAAAKPSTPGRGPYWRMCVTCMAALELTHGSQDSPEAPLSWPTAHLRFAFAHAIGMGAGPRSTDRSLRQAHVAATALPRNLRHLSDLQLAPWRDGLHAAAPALTTHVSANLSTYLDTLGLAWFRAHGLDTLKVIEQHRADLDDGSPGPGNPWRSALNHTAHLCREAGLTQRLIVAAAGRPSKL